MRVRVLLLILMVSVWMVAGPLQAQAPSSLEEAFSSFDRMTGMLKVSSLIGKPIQVQDAIIVPFSRISYGMGAGGAMMGYGGGMGAKAVPMGVLIIKGDDIRVELFPLEEKKPSFIQQILPVLFKMLPEIMGNRFPSPGPAQEKSKGQPAEASDASLEKVEKLFEEKKYDEALKAVEALIASDPKNAEFYAWKGTIMGTLSQTGGPAEMMKYGMGAMQAFEKALSLDPNNVRARFGRGIGRMVAPEGFGGDLEGAIEDFTFVCQKEPFPEAFYQLGRAYVRKGRVEDARKAFQKALELKPDYKEAAKALEEIK